MHNDDWDDIEDDVDLEELDDFEEVGEAKESAASVPEEDAAMELEAESDHTYTVQFGFTSDRKYKPGDVISVQCQHCALWNRPVPGYRPHGEGNDQVMCRPGRMVARTNEAGDTTDVPMAADTYSCQKYFIPHELSEVIEALDGTPVTVNALKWVQSTAKSAMALRARVNKNAEVYKRTDGDEVVDTVLQVALNALVTQEQLDYISPFLTHFGRFLQAQRKKLASGKFRLSPGTNVEWTDQSSGKRLTGFILSTKPKSKELLLLVDKECANIVRGDGKNVPTKLRYPLVNWAHKYNAKLLDAAEVIELDDEE